MATFQKTSRSGTVSGQSAALQVGEMAQGSVQYTASCTGWNGATATAIMQGSLDGVNYSDITGSSKAFTANDAGFAPGLSSSLINLWSPYRYLRCKVTISVAVPTANVLVTAYVQG